MQVHKLFSLSLYRTFLNPRFADNQDALKLELLSQFDVIRENKSYNQSPNSQPTGVKLNTVIYKNNSEQRKDYTRQSDSVGCFVTKIGGSPYDLTIYNPIGSIEAGLMPNNRLKYESVQDMYRTGTDLTCESVTFKLSLGDFFLWDSSVEYSITPRDDTSHVEMIMAKFYTNTHGM